MKTEFPKGFLEAMQLGQKREYKKCINLLLPLVNKEDPYSPALLYLGRSYHALDDFASALFYIRHFVALNPNESAGYFFMGRTLLSLGRIREAIPRFTTSIRLNPNHATSYSLLGFCFLKINKSKKALNLFEKAVELAPEDKQVYAGYINCLQVRAVQEFRKGDTNLAKQMFEFLLENGASTQLALTHLGNLAKNNGQWEKAKQYIAEALEMNPDDLVLKGQLAEILFHLGEKEKAANLMKEIQSVFPELKPNLLGQEVYNKLLAFRSFKEGEYSKALDMARQFLKINPEDPEAHFLMAQLKMQSKEWEAVENHLRKIIRSGMRDKELSFALALAYWHQEKYQEAAEALEHVLDEEPNEPTGLYYLTLAYCKLEHPRQKTIPALETLIRREGPDYFLFSAYAGELEKEDFIENAYHWYQKAFKLRDQDVNLLKKLIKFAEQLKDFESEAIYLSHYLTLHPNKGNIRNRLIRLYIDQKKYKNAIQYLQPGEKDLPAGTLRLQAFCYRKSGDYPKAILIYRQLCRQEPKNKDYIFNLLLCLDRNDQRDIAIPIAKEVRKRFPKDKTAHHILGLLLYKEGLFDQALKHFRALLDENQYDWRALETMGHIYKRKGDKLKSQKFYSHAQKYRK